jgi:Rrf2 family iron-sulfur cluster assembly transcriptional regulator
MVDLAQHSGTRPIHCKEIAERQEVSDQYLSQLFIKLRHADLVSSLRGPGGGYRLTRDASQITAGDVLRAVNETLDPVFCVEKGREPACHRADGCPTHTLWAQLGQAIHHVLDSVTLAELVEQTFTPAESA